MIYLNSSDFKIIVAQAEIIYPEECCGLLLGNIIDSEKIVTEVYPTENVWNEEENSILFGDNQTDNLSKKNRFTIAHEVMLQVQKKAIAQNCSIIGVYHSHPDHPAQPSESDRAIAWEEYSYIIISVQQGQVQHCQSWVLNEDRQFYEENIIITLP
jgi:proteasome lid subunit RPN8/RPN11